MYKNIKLTTQNISENISFTNYKNELCFRACGNYMPIYLCRNQEYPGTKSKYPHHWYYSSIVCKWPVTKHIRFASHRSSPMLNSIR